ncbi:MAG: nickel pincer cofactor biosynthesis protein LarB [Deltaproteobacteria bacterium]|nr:nickel pincer cofactor biosynthesis protein LarB [Deltaproteobacteria bacterium]
MDPDELKKLLQEIRKGKMSVTEGMKRLRDLPYEDLGFAHIDHHRALRQGSPEVIFCEGKTESRIVQIVERMLAQGYDVLATRASPSIYREIRKLDGKARYYTDSRTIVIRRKKKRLVGSILILSAGTSDISVAEEAAVTAETLGSRVETLYDIGVSGIHRLFDQREKIMSARVLIVVAGMEGALASVVGGLVDKPIIAVPTSIGYGASFGGIAALLGMLNSCAAGVAVVNIDNGFGAGAMAHRINLLGKSPSS